MPIQTIRYLVSGTNNGKTGTTPITVTNGSGVATVTLSSASAGTDTLVTYLDALGLSSNQAQVVWQGTNGPISIGPVQLYTMAGSGTGYFPNGLTQSSFTGPQTVNSLMFNTQPGILPSNPYGGTNGAARGEGAGQKFINLAITNTGVYSGTVVLTGNTTGAFNMVATGSFVVAAAGKIVFTCYANGGFCLGIGNSASYYSGTNTNSGVTTTPFNHYPVVGAFNGPNWTFPGGISAVTSFTVNFPSPGVYPYDLCFTAGTAQERTLNLLANNAVIPPVQLIATPPAPNPAAAGAKLALTPVSAGSYILGTTATFQVTASGLVFSTIPYIPLLEGTPARLFLTNTNGTGFSFPSLPNGTSVDPNLAQSLLTLSGDNSSYKSKLAIQWNGTSYTLQYNGNPPDSGIATTQLSCSAVDIAWYNPAGLLDAYQASARGGGSSNTIQVNWLVKPSIASYVPTFVVGNASPTTILFTLTEPLPPLQQTATIQVTVGTGLTLNSVAPVTNGMNWISGYNITVTPPTVTATANSSITITLSDTQTYMQDAAFVTNTITYVNGVTFPVSITVPPAYKHQNSSGTTT